MNKTEIWRQGDCICEYAMQLLMDNFFELKDRIRIYILNNIGSESVFPRNDYERYFADEGYEELAQKFSSLRDSRIQGWGQKQKVQWVFIAKGTSDMIKVLAELVLDELSEKFIDYLYVERLEESILDWRKGKKLEDKRRDYFFGRIQDGEKMRNACVKKILINNQLPPWQLLVQISSQFYEKRPLNTKLFFAKKGSLSQQSLIKLIGNNSDENWQEKYKLSWKNLRTIRKLMEAAPYGQGLLVSVEDYIIRGIAEQQVCEEISEVCIKFQGHLNWKVIKKGEDILWYRDGEYQFSEFGKTEPEYIQKLNDIAIKMNQKEKIRKIITKLSKQPHGTSIIFMDQKSLLDEVERLVSLNRGHKVEAFQLSGVSDEMLMGITSIDGALMADLDGMCYVIGAILDGDAAIKGDPGRGARYNSLTNYVVRFAQRKEEKAICFAAIFSEDDRINLEVAN